jgi:hypothetical protein
VERRFVAAIGPRAGLAPVNLPLGVGRPGGSGALAAMSKAGGSGAHAAIFGRFAAAIGPRAGLPPANLPPGIGRPGGSGALAAMGNAGGSGALAAIFGRFAAAIGPRAGPHSATCPTARALNCPNQEPTLDRANPQGAPTVGFRDQIRPQQLVLHCYAEAVNGQWQAFCLDFDLAAQADTFEATREKLDLMISEYGYDALAGEDREHAAALLRRRSPWWMWAKFYWRLAMKQIDPSRRTFLEPIPLVPAGHA